MKRLNIATSILCSTALFLISCPGIVSAAQLLGRPVKPDPEAVVAGIVGSLNWTVAITEQRDT